MNPRDLIYLQPAGTADRLKGVLNGLGWRVHRASDIPNATGLLERYRPCVGIVSLSVDDEWQGEWLESGLAGPADIRWIALLDRDQLLDTNVARLVSDTCFDYHTLPVDPERLALTLGHAYGMARIASAAHGGSPKVEDLRILGESRPIRRLNRDIRKIGATDIPVLITGESGTGKELVARGIHQHSSRRSAPFVAINCGALPTELIQSELFGHERGAFTGAAARRLGRVEAADGGTLFLDEIGDLPLEQQVSLLRFLQEGTIQRLGGHEDLAVDVRVIAATNVDLELAMREGRFREDLYYRLNVVSVHTPPLREHPEDIELLAGFFLERFTSDGRSAPKAFSRPAVRVMSQHHWPGNVRELINRVRRAVVMSDSRLISPAHLGLERRAVSRQVVTLQDAKAQAEKAVVERALQYAGNNISEAARQLGVSRVTLYTLLKKYGLAGEPVAVAS